MNLRVYTPGGTWDDAGKVPGLSTARPAVLVSHKGSLYVLAVARDGQLTGKVLEQTGSSDGWLPVTFRGPNGEDRGVKNRTLFAPGAVVYKNQIHIVRYGAATVAATEQEPAGYLFEHLLLGSGDATVVSTFTLSAAPTSRLSLAAHGDSLHLVYAEGDRLAHATFTATPDSLYSPTFDGITWVEQPDSPATGTEQTAVASAVYDGKIYAAYNVTVTEHLKTEELIDAEIARRIGAFLRISGEDGKPRAIRLADLLESRTKQTAENAYLKLATHLLREGGRGTGRASDLLAQALRGQTVPETVEETRNRVGYQVFDGAAWSGEVVLPVNAGRPPALAVYHEPGDPERGRLLLSYSGSELWTPTPPPAPAPIGAEVTSRKREAGYVAKG
ncbi:hypothetical protein [Streptomyces sp. NPDC058401]|uniref:hypothetical protein n=1 Tax=Streptomyces sp. NPDC058401 TaxID=3346480 RepID=UPI00364FF508